MNIGVQDGVHLEDDLCNLRLQRLREVQQPIYIHPMAKASLHASDYDDLFSLKEKVKEFLASPRQVILVLGDLGVGKSTFSRHLEHQLWTDYERGGPIPLYINLPTIDDPEHDLIEKQLQYHNFADDQIQEMKQQRQFILLCDGYDESQLKINIYTTNRFNQPGQWKVKMVITCRTQYLGQVYRYLFEPQSISFNQPNLFQEAVIAPLSKEQIEEYVNCYVQLQPRPWDAGDYLRMLATIPSLMTMVRIPFFLTIALEVLPSIAEGQQDLSTVKVTRVQLYDVFFVHWLNVSKRRLQSNELSQDDRRVFNQLLDAGFISMGIDYTMRLALAKFERQVSVVQYNHRRDHNTWKAEFFGTDPVARLLQESCPLTRRGYAFQFLHKSMLEYFISLVVYNPVRPDDDFEMQTEAPPSTIYALDPSNPLFRHNLLNESSVIQFLCDRVKLDSNFSQLLLSVVNHSKTNTAVTTTTATTTIAAANAITILVRAGVNFHGADLCGVKIAGADLSGGQFDHAQFQGADLRDVNLSRSWLRKADMSGAQMDGVQFGGLPYLEMDGSVEACAYSPDARMLAVVVAGLGGGISIYDTSSWTRTCSFTGPFEVHTMAFSPDGARLVFGGLYGLVRLWDCASGQEMFVMEGHNNDVKSVAFSPRGKHIASCSRDKTVRVWDSQTGECHFVLEGHTDGVMSVEYYPSGLWLVSGGSDGTIRFWNSETGELGIALDSSLGGVYKLAFSPDGRWIASGHVNGRLQFWDTVSGEPGPVLQGHVGGVTGIAFSPDNRWFASSSMDKTIRFWDALTGTFITTLSSHTAFVNAVAFSPNCLQIASGGNDKKVRLWDVDSTLRSSVEQQDQRSAVEKTAYSPNGQCILTVGDSQIVKQWSSLTGASRPLQIELPESISVKSVSYSLDGIPTAAVVQDGTLRLWELQEGRREAVLEGSRGANCVIMSPCCRWIVSSDRDDTVKMWDLASAQQMHVLIENGGPTREEIRCLAFSSTGHQLAIGNRSGTIWLFDPQSKDLITSKSTRWGFIEAISFSPDGQQLAVGAGDRLIYLWGLQSDERAIELRGHTEVVKCIAYSPCGDRIASGSGDKTVRVWLRRQTPGDTESWSCVSTVHGFFDAVLDIAWSPTVPMDFVTGCGDGSVRVWRVSSDGEDVVVRLLWGTNLAVLHADGVVFKGATGLGPMHRKLLIQCGAIEDSLNLEEVGGLGVEE